MKTFNLKYFIVAFLSFTLLSCEDDNLVTLKNSATLVAEASDDAYVLLKENENEESVTISWEEPDYGYKASANYYIYIDKESGDFSKAVVVNNGNALGKTFTTSAFNAYMAQLKLKAGEVASVKVKVEARLTSSLSIFSEPISFNVTPYSAFLELATAYGVVGGAYNNWGNAPDAPFYVTSTPGIIVAYVKVRAGEIKFRLNNDWGTNYGDNGANGSLEQNGANIAVTAGSKKITINTNNMTYTIEDYSWGIVGSAWNNWGSDESTPGVKVPDLEFVYDDAFDKWRAIGKLKAGFFKIRKNNNWSVNYGDNGNNGTLDAGGSDIQVSAAGKYLITFDANDFTYEIEPISNAWGLVGSAWNNWAADSDNNGIQDLLDAQFARDFRNDNVWIINNIVLQAGEFKIRDANDWGTNYGDNGANGSLELNGANIVAVGGLYTVKLDFSTATPTIQITKWPN